MDTNTTAEEVLALATAAATAVKAMEAAAQRLVITDEDRDPLRAWLVGHVAESANQARWAIGSAASWAGQLARSEKREAVPCGR